VLEDARHSLEQSEKETGQEMASAADDLHEQQRQGLEADVAECVRGWGEDLPAALQEEVRAFEQPFQQIYEAFEEQALTDGREVAEGISRLVQETADSVRHTHWTEIEDALEKAFDESQQASTEVRAAIEVMSGGEHLTCALDPMVNDLEIARRVIGEIDQIVKEME